MSCFSRPDWPQYFQCVREFLIEPVPLWIPWGVWLLLIFGSGMVLGALGVLLIKWLLGEEAILKPFDLIFEWYDAGAAFLSRLSRRFRPEAATEPAGETPADPVREETIASAMADKAPAGRRPKGD